MVHACSCSIYHSRPTYHSTAAAQCMTGNKPAFSANRKPWPRPKTPVCKIMNFGKFRPATAEADYRVKLRHLLEFLEEGDRVRVFILFKGRELSHKELTANNHQNSFQNQQSYTTLLRLCDGEILSGRLPPDEEVRLPKKAQKLLKKERKNMNHQSFSIEHGSLTDLENVCSQLSLRRNGFFHNIKWIQKGFNANRFLIARGEAGDTAGFLVYEKDFSPCILNIWPPLRRSGAGRQLFEFLLAKASASGHGVMNVECMPKSSRGFWKKMGFTRERLKDDPSEILCYRVFEGPSHIEPGDWRTEIEKEVNVVFYLSSGKILQKTTVLVEHLESDLYFKKAVIFYLPQHIDKKRLKVKVTSMDGTLLDRNIYDEEDDETWDIFNSISFTNSRLVTLEGLSWNLPVS